MNWFQRHLNWTALLGYLLPFILFNVLFWSGNLLNGHVVIGGIFTLFISAWVIVGKGRRLGWLLLFPVFSPLWLRNKTSLTP